MNTEETLKLINEFNLFLKKFSIDHVVLSNSDDASMGYLQLIKLSEADGDRYLILLYSSSGQQHCTCSLGDE